MNAAEAPYSFRPANPKDAEAIALHRAWMFRDMGLVSDTESEGIFQASISWFEGLLSKQEYIGWLATRGKEIVAGAGVHLRTLGPMPGCSQGGLGGHIANVYTMVAHRRQGLARRLMELILSWAEREQLNLLTLSASEEGSTLYESLGFAATAGMQMPIKPLRQFL